MIPQSLVKNNTMECVKVSKLKIYYTPLFMYTINNWFIETARLCSYLKKSTTFKRRNLYILVYFNGVPLWGIAADINRIFVMQKRDVRAFYKPGPRVSLRDKFQDINIFTSVEQ